MKIRVAACQIRTSSVPEESAEKIITWMKTASDYGVDVVSFPEASICNYHVDPEYWKNANPDDFESAEKKVLEAARQLNIAVVLGTVHWVNGSIFNSLLVIDKGGIIRGRYSKTHLAESWSTEGDILPIYMVSGVESCFIICHDIRYPELVRLPAICGARICYYCSNESGLLQEYKLSAYRAMPISRATENGIFLVMANAPADPDNMRSKSQSHGNSMIVHPDGNVLGSAGYFEETLITATIDTKDASRTFALRSVNDNTILKEWMQEGVKLVKKEETIGL